VTLRRCRNHKLDRRTYRKFTVHPRANHFSAEEFAVELGCQGIAVGSNYIKRFFRDFVIGVERRSE
jgi:hypothetical protein